MMSLTVVMKGPVARAGSILYRSSISGTNVPNSAAKTMTQSRAMLTVMLKAVPNPRTMLDPRIRMPQMMPLMSPTPSSLERRLRMLPAAILLAARPCTTMAADCTPTFPPIAAINGMNKAISAFSWMSKAPMTYAPPSPPTRPISSHGSRARVKVHTLSLDSTSSEIPLASW